MIKRQYFHSPEEQEVQHRFVYKGKSATDVGAYRVRITAREDLEKNAYTLAEPVVVDVFGR
jgi:hypothetical protein